MPPPLNAVFPVMVLSLTVSVPSLRMPPPSPVLWVMVLSVIVCVPLPRKIAPPPLPSKTLSWAVSSFAQMAPPPTPKPALLPENVLLETVSAPALMPPREGRHVKASPALLGALRTHVEATKVEGEVKGWSPEQRQLVFPNNAGRVMQYSTFIEDVWQPLLAKAGLPLSEVSCDPPHVRNVAPRGRH